MKDDVTQEQVDELLQHPRFRNDPGYEFEVRAKAKQQGLTIRKDQSVFDSEMGGYMLVDPKAPDINIIGHGSRYDQCLWEIDLYLDEAERPKKGTK